jgi:hypothetical protein
VLRTLFAVPDTLRRGRARREIVKRLRKALKTRHFSMALYRRDSLLAIAEHPGRFIASVKIGML